MRHSLVKARQALLEISQHFSNGSKICPIQVIC